MTTSPSRVCPITPSRLPAGSGGHRAGPDLLILVIDTRVAVIGAGQAGLSAGYHLRRAGLAAGAGFVMLDRSPGPGGAWQFRWPSLTLSTVNGVHDLPGMPLEVQDASRPASEVVSEYFARYERTFDLNVRRPVHVSAVRDDGERLVEVDGVSCGEEHGSTGGR